MYLDKKTKGNPEASIFDEDGTTLLDKKGTIKVRAVAINAMKDFRTAMERQQGGGVEWVGFG